MKFEQAKSARINEKNAKILEEKDVEMETLKTQNNEIKALLGILNILFSFFKGLTFNSIHFHVLKTQKFSNMKKLKKY